MERPPAFRASANDLPKGQQHAESVTGTRQGADGKGAEGPMAQGLPRPAHEHHRGLDHRLDISRGRWELPPRPAGATVKGRRSTP